MMIRNLNEVMYEAINSNIAKDMDKLGTIEVVCLLDDRLKERGLTQKEFSRLTGLREATISNWINLKKLNINIGHLVIMMTALQITDITELFKIEFEKDLLDKMAINKAKWINTGDMPEEIRQRGL